MELGTTPAPDDMQSSYEEVVASLKAFARINAIENNSNTYDTDHPWSTFPFPYYLGMALPFLCIFLPLSYFFHQTGIKVICFVTAFTLTALTWSGAETRGVSFQALKRETDAIEQSRNRGRFIGELMKIEINRDFCLTRRGALGWVPDRSETSDYICILENCRIPYMIRPKMDGSALVGFEFLGDCYLQGLMEYQPAEFKDAEWEDIKLV